MTIHSKLTLYNLLVPTNQYCVEGITDNLKSFSFPCGRFHCVTGRSNRAVTVKYTLTATGIKQNVYSIPYSSAGDGPPPIKLLKSPLSVGIYKWKFNRTNETNLKQKYKINILTKAQIITFLLGVHYTVMYLHAVCGLKVGHNITKTPYMVSTKTLMLIV